MPKRILLAYDGSEPAQKAFEFALQLLRREGGELAIVAVIRSSEFAVDVGAQNLIEGACAMLGSEMERLQRRVQFAGANSSIVIRLGQPAQQILQVAREWHADLIVTGQRAGFSLTRYLGGSVSNQIRARSPCGLHVVR
jgi:nucleotide-binding universal stress UspA family protein